MEILKAVILGIIQGLTEFLPVSSSAHLVLFQDVLKVKDAFTLDVFLHFGTLIAVSIFYWEDIWGMLTFKAKYRKFSLYVILGSIPAGIIGVFFNDFVERLFSSLEVSGYALLFTGLLLWLSDRITNTTRNLAEMKLSDAIVVGVAQALAIVPGISRSGSTIVAGLVKGLDRKLAAKYSFLLSVPVILGATLFEFKDIMTVGLVNNSIGELFFGTLASMIAGYFAIKLLVRLINQERLSFFAYYCWGLGLLIILLR